MWVFVAIGLPLLFAVVATIIVVQVIIAVVRFTFALVFGLLALRRPRVTVKLR